MKLFIFKPAEGWDCGGLIITAAETFKQAVKITMDYYAEENTIEVQAIYKRDNDKGGPCEWVLAREIECSEVGAGVIVGSWNYA